MHMIFCPRCGKRLTAAQIEHRERPICHKEEGGCGFVDYGRYTLGVGGIVVKEEGGARRVLLIQRNHEPNRGGWTIPGGYVESNETAEVSVVREVEEETGLRCEVVGFVGFRNRVDADANSAYVMFLMRQVGGQTIPVPNEEIADIKFLSLSELDAIPRLTPLSKTIAVAALTDALPILRMRSVASIGGRPPVNVFMG